MVFKTGLNPKIGFSKKSKKTSNKGLGLGKSSKGRGMSIPK